MGRFDVCVFLTHCFVPTTIRVTPDVKIEPFYGIGATDVADLIGRYTEEVLKQPSQPIAQRASMSDHIREQGASAVVTFSDVAGDDYIEAVEATEASLLLYRDILALRQLQRGYIAGFLVMQTDASPVMLHTMIRPPYAVLRRVRNLPFFETESDVLARIAKKATKSPILRIYLSLYADATAYSDTLVLDISQETRLVKTWTLLETMASSEQGTKKQKVKALFRRYQTSTEPGYMGHEGHDLLDIAYKWRNIVVHCGGCSAAIHSSDVNFCQTFQSDLERIVEDLNQSCWWLLHAFANSLP